MKPLYRPPVKTVAGPLNGQHYSIPRRYSPPAAQDRRRRKVAETPCKQRAFPDPPRTPAGPLPDPFPSNTPPTRPAPALPPQRKRSKLWSEPLFRSDRPAGSRRHSLKFRMARISSNRRSKPAHTSGGTACMATLQLQSAHPWAQARKSAATRGGTQAQNP